MTHIKRTEFEDLVAGAFQKRGYDIEADPKAADVGVDFVAVDNAGRRWAVQLKYQQGKSVPASEAVKAAWSLRYAQDVIGAAGAFLVVDSTASSFAGELVSKSGVRLLDRDALYEAVSTRSDDATEAAGAPTASASHDRRDAGSQKRKPSHVPRHEDLRSRLRDLPCGPDNWRAFENLAIEILNHLFIPPLGIPKIQSVSEDGLDRRDAVYKIGYGNAFWEAIKTDCRTRFVVAEFKNGCAAPDQGDVASIAKYLWGDGLRSFGILCARKKPSKSALAARRRAWTKEHVLIIFCDDEDLAEMLVLKATNENPTASLDRKVDEFLSTVDA